MNKEKLKHLPINLMLSSCNAAFAFIMLLEVTKQNTFVSAGIAIIIWLNLAQHGTDIDYLEERIKKLEEKQNEQPAAKSLPSVKS